MIATLRARLLLVVRARTCVVQTQRRARDALARSRQCPRGIPREGGRLTAYLPASIAQRRDPARYRSRARNFWALLDRPRRSDPASAAQPIDDCDRSEASTRSPRCRRAVSATNAVRTPDVMTPGSRSGELGGASPRADRDLLSLAYGHQARRRGWFVRTQQRTVSGSAMAKRMVWA
jgi:hypothetical protein